MSMDCDYIHEDGEPYPQARPPRREDGCPACGADITPTKTKEVWPQHTIGGVKGLAKCDLSGRNISSGTDDYFRTFYDREHAPHDDQYCEHHVIVTELGDFGDAFGLESQVLVPSGHGGEYAVAKVRIHITQDDYPRFRDELDRIARWRGWPGEAP